MKYCFDFDGVIHDPYTRKEGYKMGIPVPGALEFLTALVKTDQVYIYSARVQKVENIKHIEDWLTFFHFPASIQVRAFKPVADYYIDDKAVRFTGDWTEIPHST